MFSALKSVTQRIVDEIGCFPKSGYYMFSVASENIDGQDVEFFESSFAFYAEEKKFDAFNTSSEFVRDQHSFFEELRNEMASKDKDNLKWIEAKVVFGENGEVKTRYNYPEATNCS